MTRLIDNFRFHYSLDKILKHSIGLIFLILSINCHAQLVRKVSINPAFSSWSIQPSVTEAGLDYVNQYESAVGQFKINMEVPLLLSSAKVLVQHNMTNWNPSLILSIKRVGAGSTLLCVGCSISGGENYLTISSATAVELMRASTTLSLLSFNNIDMQLRIAGVSVTVPAKTYDTTIVFTISAL